MVGPPSDPKDRVVFYFKEAPMFWVLVSVIFGVPVLLVLYYLINSFRG